ncbi:MAG: penicillin-binding protein activator LpoB [Treponema sp.]|jgi:TolB-like protein|nr:penicillin-binding protein activator LpoB [Treponema sp.]
MFYKRAAFFVLAILASSRAFSQTVSIDEAIQTSSRELEQRLAKGSKAAVLNFASDWSRVSSYVIDELNNAIVRENVITVVDRRQLDLIRQEQNFQMSGEVSDASAQSIGQLLGAETIVSGSMELIGSIYRFRIRAIGVETGVIQYSNSLNIVKDEVLSALTRNSDSLTTVREEALSVLEPEHKEEASSAPAPERYETITTGTGYTFVEKLGIGLLNIPFGLGFLIYEPDDLWWWPVAHIGVTAGWGLVGFAIAAGMGEDTDDALEFGLLIAGAAGFVPGAVLGFVLAFALDTKKEERARVASFPAVKVNVVPTSSRNLGVQLSCSWWIK